MEFGLSFEKLLLIGVIAVLIVGPERLPKYAESFAKLVRKGGEYLRDTRTRVREEMGAEVDDVDWRKLDPRQYDPRRIIRDALFEDDPVAPAAAAATSIREPAPAAPVKPAHTPRVRPEFTRASPPPYDIEAT
ncbi:MAG: twin-arginine translocase TatA/TatE family subunit [Actinomycetota bacterium]